ncbi:hypothetical protein GCM10027614_80510 [Micromonospora vulcania]
MPGPPGPARPFWTSRRRDQLTGYLFIAPQLLGSVVFVILPLILVFWYSLHEWNVLAGTFDFVGTDNYKALTDDSNLGGVLRATGLFSIGLVVLNLGLALLLAVLLNQRLRGTILFRTLFFSPWWSRWWPGPSSGASCSRTTAGSTGCSTPSAWTGRTGCAARAPRWCP